MKRSRHFEMVDSKWKAIVAPPTFFFLLQRHTCTGFNSYKVTQGEMEGKHEKTLRVRDKKGLVRVWHARLGGE